MELNEHSNLSAKGLYDYKLVQRALGNSDQKAYEELLGRYELSVYYMLLKMVNNKDDAEDLTIEAFGKAFKRLDQYTPDFAFSTWLFRIATNNCIDFIRKKRKTLFPLISRLRMKKGELHINLRSDLLDPEQHIMKKKNVVIA